MSLDDSIDIDHLAINPILEKRLPDFFIMPEIVFVAILNAYFIKFIIMHRES